MNPQDEVDVYGFGHIVHPTDLTTAGETAFAHALRLALAAKGHLRIVHVEKPGIEEDPNWTAFPGVRSLLGRWGLLSPGAPPSEVGEQLGLRVSKADLSGTEAARTLVRFFEEHRCDLLVLATHAREGFARLLHGSFAEALARQAQVPTLFLPLGARGFVDPATGTAHLRNILVPVDRTPPREAATSLALKMADLLGCSEAVAQLLHVGSPDEAPIVAVAPEHEPRLRRIGGEGGVVPSIIDAAARIDADLIVMTTQGHDSMLDALRGSTTEQVLRHAGRALLAVPAV